MTFRQNIKISLLVLLVVTCSNESTTNTKAAVKRHWQSFTLRLEDTSIVQGQNTSDSIEIKSRDGKTTGYYVGKQGIDSLFSWAEYLLDYKQPVEIRTCTDYVGKLSVQVRYSDILTKRVDFTSICNWKEFTSETGKIDSILKLSVNR